MEAAAQQRCCFGPFLLDPVEKVLLRNGHPVPLPPKALETLLALVEKRGHLLEKAELLNQVWRDTFVEEATLAQNIFTLRKALGDSPDGHEYIETVPKRGYRFVAPVNKAQQEVRTSERATFLRTPLSRRLFWAMLGILVAMVSLGIYLRVRPHRPAPTPGAGKVMLAVLPFENLSGDPREDYFSDGFTEEVITQLGTLEPGRLGVIARTSTMQYKESSKRVAEIGRELGVDYVLEGSVRRAGDRVRISAQLIQAWDQTHCWAHEYDRAVRDILELESEAARDIARQVRIQLTPKRQVTVANPLTVDPDAYQLYLKGRYFWNRRTEVAYKKAIEYFEQAVRKDPQYAPAYAGLADSYLLLGIFGQKPPNDTVPRARAAALRAIEIDENSADAHASMGYLVSRYDLNWSEAEREFQRAIELNPNYPTAHHWYSLHLASMGRLDEAIGEMKRAQSLDPASPIINTDVGLVFYYARQYGRAIEQCQRALELDPNFGLARRTLGSAYVEKGLYNEAIAEFEKAMTLLGEDPWTLAEIGRTYALMGERGRALGIVDELHRLSKQRFVAPAVMAVAYVGLSDKKNEAFYWLGKGYLLLAVDPRFDSLRKDPRFEALLTRMGLRPTITK